MSEDSQKSSDDSKPVCGIIMPISAIDGYPSEHWSEVLSIFRDAILAANFDPNLVSDADDIGIIQKRIVQNIYNNQVVVCDVSGKNPNVMFELGMRLAFDKPTIIVKDDLTNYSFDTSVIEHLEYPHDLRFTKILAFKEKLADKITATYQKADSDPKYSTFLRSFGEYKVSHLQSKEVSSEVYMLECLEDIKRELRLLKRTTSVLNFSTVTPDYNDDCISTHISEYAHEHYLPTMYELRKHKGEILDYLKSMQHVVARYVTERQLISKMDTALDNDSLLEKFPPEFYGLLKEHRGLDST
ncbi:MAG TPA: hypothetical protein VGB02_02740 [Pyrinomonadaceae bacterium]|jgi:hypothetical protein